MKKMTTMGNYLFPIIILILISTAFQAMAVDVFVSTTGSNRNPGTITAPFRTIQRALDLATPGTKIYVRGGTYNERLLWKNSGAAASTILLSNYGREVVYVDGTNATNSSRLALLEIPSKSYIKINGLRFQNNYRNHARGIHIHGKGTRIEVTNCRITKIGWTTKVDSLPESNHNANPFIIVGDSATAYAYLTISGNEIAYCITGYSESLTVTGNVTYFKVLNNRVHDNTNIGIVVAGHYSWTEVKGAESMNQARYGTIIGNAVYRCVSQRAISAGIYVDGGQWITIQGNKSFENGTGISIGCENSNRTARWIKVRSNFIYNNNGAGIMVGANAPGSRVESSSVRNNTFFKNYSKGGYGGEIHLQHTSGISFRSNIIYSRSDIAVIALLHYTSTGLSMNYNQYFTASGNSNTIIFDWGGLHGRSYLSLASFQSGTGLEANGRYANPLFVSATLPSPNLHLTSFSSAINSGDSYTPAYDEKDIDGQNRLQSGRVDVGADETPYTNSPSVRVALNEGQEVPLKLYPNPASTHFYLDRDAVIKIISVNGKEALRGRYEKGRPIDISHLPKGIYIVNDEIDNSNYKLIIN